MPGEDQTDIPQLLKRLPLFAELSTEQIDDLAAGTREKRLAKGEMLFNKGDAPRGLYLIVSGQIKLAFPSLAGNEKVIEIIGPKQSFGEAVMFMDRPYPVFAEALAYTLLLHIGKSTVFGMLEHDVSFARRMLAGLSLRLHSLVNDVEAYSQRSSAQRVIGYLLEHSAQAGDDNGACAFALPTTKQVIASRLNLTPETLSRVFHDLAEAGLITVEGRQITIHDQRRLREFDL